MAHHTISWESNPPYFLHILMLSRDLYSESFSPQQLLCGRDSRVDTSMNTKILISLYQSSNIFYPPPLPNSHFLLRPLTFILRTTFSNPVAL